MAPIAGWFSSWKILLKFDDNWGYSYLRKPPFTWENDDQRWDFGKDRWRKAWDNFQGGNGFPAKSSKLLIIFDGNNPMVWGSTRILGINMCIEPRSSAFAFAAIRQEPGNQFGKRLWWIQVLTIPNFTWNGLWMPSKDVYFLVCYMTCTLSHLKRCCRGSLFIPHKISSSKTH